MWLSLDLKFWCLQLKTVTGYESDRK